MGLNHVNPEVALWSTKTDEEVALWSTKTDEVPQMPVLYGISVVSIIIIFGYEADIFMERAGGQKSQRPAFQDTSASSSGAPAIPYLLASSVSI